MAEAHRLRIGGRDAVAKIAQKDVNNYVEVQPSGKAKAKGGYLVKGVAPAGAFNINNSCCIVATALKEYFVNGTPVEDTINGCEDIFQFQIVAKAGAKYQEAYHLVDGEQVPVQKVNRVYATADTATVSCSRSRPRMIPPPRSKCSLSIALSTTIITSP